MGNNVNDLNKYLEQTFAEESTVFDVEAMKNAIRLFQEKSQLQDYKPLLYKSQYGWRMLLGGKKV
jgi:hypothetical protein